MRTRVLRHTALTHKSTSSVIEAVVTGRPSTITFDVVSFPWSMGSDAKFSANALRTSSSRLSVSRLQNKREPWVSADLGTEQTNDPPIHDDRSCCGNGNLVGTIRTRVRLIRIPAGLCESSL